MSGVIRRADSHDAPAMHAIGAASFSTPESIPYLLGELERRELTRYFVCLDDAGAIVAYGGYWHVVDEGQVMNIAVQPDKRGQGYGERIVRAMLDMAKGEGCETMLLEVRVTNTPAFTLYTKLGFSILSIRKDYYTEPVEDAYVMECNLAAYEPLYIETKG